MNPNTLLADAEAYVKQLFSSDSSGHDWWHVDRVRKVALRIAREENADLLIVELAALLHDVADWKFAGGDHEAGPRQAKAWLLDHGASAALAEQVATIVRELSFKGAGVATPMSTLEGACVQDADRIDAIGAIGAARAFAYGGHKGRAMHDPAVPPQMHADFAAYKKNDGPTINHFYEKLLLLKDRINTPAGKKIAQQRHAFLQQFLDQFLAEWDGK